MRTLSEAYGYKARCISVTSEERTRALLPLMEIDSWLTGKRGVGLPFTDECEPLAADPAAIEAAFEAAKAVGFERGWKRIELRTGAPCLSGAIPSSRFYSHELDLTPGQDALFDRFSSANRRAIRKAEKSGLQVDFATDLNAAREFYGLLALTRRRHGLPPQPFRFFEALVRNVLKPGLGLIALAKWRGRAVAGAVFLHHKHDALYKFGASNEALQGLRSNNLVMWHAIQWHLQHGFETLGFGRTSLGNEGLRSFKLGWHALEKIKHYYRFDLRTRSFAVDTDRELGWHNRVFRSLPLSLSRFAGHLLYRHIG